VLLLGIVGAVIGALGGTAFRAKLAAGIGKDIFAAIIEDAIKIIGASLLVAYLA